jgi:hypothetical protein
MPVALEFECCQEIRTLTLALSFWIIIFGYVAVSRPKLEIFFSVVQNMLHTNCALISFVYILCTVKRKDEHFCVRLLVLTWRSISSLEIELNLNKKSFTTKIKILRKRCYWGWGGGWTALHTKRGLNSLHACEGMRCFTRNCPK